MKLPKLKLKLNSTLTKEFFLTDTDDIYFARNQIKQIDKRISTLRIQNLKPWERLDNNIYSSLNKTNKYSFREKKKRIRNNNLSFNWNNNNLNIFNKTEISNIDKCEEIKKQLKIKYDIKYKYKEPNITISNFITTKNETILTNKIIDILKEEQNKIKNKQKNYEESLKYENKSLDKNINKFNEFIIKTKKKTQEKESLLLKAIIDNKNLVDLYKKQLQEYNSTIYEVYKYIKLINNLKHYAFFIHKLLGGDNDILHCDLIEKINFNNFKNLDILAITHKIIQKTKNIITNNNELNMYDQNTINNFDLSFKAMEEKLIKRFIEKEDYLSGKDIIIEKGKFEKEAKLKKYDELKQNYNNQKIQLNEKIKEYNNIFFTPKERENIEFFYTLLKDIYSSLFGINKIKKFNFKLENSIDMQSDVVSPILKEIYRKEEKINHLINIMEKNENENNIVFNKLLNKRKLENRALKLFNEKEFIKIRDNIRRKKYNEKMRKIIIKGRYKYNSSNTPEVTKHHLNRINKTEINDFNLLNYK